MTQYARDNYSVAVITVHGDRPGSRHITINIPTRLPMEHNLVSVFLLVSY